MRIDLEAIGVVKRGASNLEVLVYSEFTGILENILPPAEILLIHRGKRSKVRQVEVSAVKLLSRNGNILTVSGLGPETKDHAVIDIRTKLDLV